MSADRLREAARVLRERADHAGEPPWLAEVHDDGRAWVGDSEDAHAFSLIGWPAAARYIAMMHPGVGLALADWLDREATFTGYMTPEANRLADLILGGAS